MGLLWKRREISSDLLILSDICGRFFDPAEKLKNHQRGEGEAREDNTRERAELARLTVIVARPGRSGSHQAQI